MKAIVDQTSVLASLCKDSFEDFVREFWAVVVPEQLVWNWHMSYMCERLQYVAERVFRGAPREADEIINIAPGSSKSLICSVMFPAWVWTRFPSARTIGASYSYPLAMDLSRKCRDLVKSDQYRACFPGIELREDQDAKGYFANTKGGMRYAVGSGGSVTGMHAHFIVIDDPIDPNKAVSDAELATTNHWLKHTLSSRKVDKRVTVSVLVMQRLHEEDPTALFLQKKKINQTSIPATIVGYEPKPDFLRKFYVNGLMDSNRLDQETLDEIRSEMGNYGFASQYGQTPVPAEGGKFRTQMLRFGPPPEKFVSIVRFWDKAGTAETKSISKNIARISGGQGAIKGGGKYTVGLKMGLAVDGRVFVLNVLRMRLDSFSREELIRRTAASDGHGCVVGLEQEGGSGGKESAEGTVRRLLGYRVKVTLPKGDKELRAEEFSVQVNGGNVWLVQAPWNAEYVNELKYFPYSAFSDQVDASSGAFGLLARKKRRIGAMRSKAAEW